VHISPYTMSSLPLRFIGKPNSCGIFLRKLDSALFGALENPIRRPSFCDR